MKENIYNLFLFGDDKEVKELGVVIRESNETDTEKLLFLQMRVDEDHKSAKRYALKRPMKWNDYDATKRLGRQLEVFEKIFRDCQAPREPLCVVTPIVNGSPKILALVDMGPLTLSKLRNTPLAGPEVMVDYLEAYVENGHFDLPKLMNDDYFKAIKLLFNAGLFVSAAKLLMSFIDTIAFIDKGDTPRNFVRWLDQYALLAPLGVTSSELWEFRNGLVHMTNLNSRNVANGSTSRLIMYVGNVERSGQEGSQPAKYFSLKGLIDIVAEAISRWANTYNSNPNKLAEFVSRYDLTVSDSRLAIVHL